ncbi:MAG: metallophosphoesterase [Moraxellaceae bacterium]|nr:metallophosphoesterase [Moraxellaceae bacterium]
MIYLLGDVHQRFNHILPALLPRQKTDGEQAIIFLGDIECKIPFEEQISPLLKAGIECWFIHGNHDTDQQKYWQNLSGSIHRNLDGRVVTIQGKRIAGLGGVFRGAIWYPPSPQCHQSMEAFKQMLYLKSAQYPEGKLLKHYSSIWPDIYDALSIESADVLVTHEAPSCHVHGFETLDELAKCLGVKQLFHGHHHKKADYSIHTERLGFEAFSVPFQGIMTLDGDLIWAP